MLYTWIFMQQWIHKVTIFINLMGKDFLKIKLKMISGQHLKVSGTLILSKEGRTVQLNQPALSDVQQVINNLDNLQVKGYQDELTIAEAQDMLETLAKLLELGD